MHRRGQRAAPPSWAHVFRDTDRSGEGSLPRVGEVRDMLSCGKDDFIPARWTTPICGRQCAASSAIQCGPGLSNAPRSTHGPAWRSIAVFAKRHCSPTISRRKASLKIGPIGWRKKPTSKPRTESGGKPIRGGHAASLHSWTNGNRCYTEPSGHQSAAANPSRTESPMRSMLDVNYVCPCITHIRNNATGSRRREDASCSDFLMRPIVERLGSMFLREVSS